MRFGLVMSSCVRHEYEAQAWLAARTYSRSTTNCVRVFNGTEPWIESGDGALVLHSRERQPYEGFVYVLAFDLAQHCGWDWCAIVHDDQILGAAGWEAQIEAAVQDSVRVGVAGWCVYDMMDVNGFGSNVIQSQQINHHRIGVYADGCGIVFNMQVFHARGRFSDWSGECGWGDLDACGYALRQGHAVLNLGLASHHAGNVTRNALGLSVDDRTMVAHRFADVLPAQVIFPPYTLLLANREVKVQ